MMYEIRLHTDKSKSTSNKISSSVAIIFLCLYVVFLIPEDVSGQGAQNTYSYQNAPNIIFIMADDLGYADINSFDPLKRTFYETPNIDRLAQEGIKFLHAYSSGANCAPTRAALVTGQYFPNQPIYHVGNPGSGAMIPAENAHELPADKFTSAEALKKAGYSTALIGKWHLGDPPTHGPQQQGYEVNIGGYGAGNPGVWEGGFFEPNNNPYIDDAEEGEYLTDYKTRKAIEFITENSDGPFYLNLSLYTPHWPLQAPEHVVKKYENKEPEGGHYNATYAAMIEIMDRNVGKIVETVDNLGIAEETMIIFYSDNGGIGGYDEIEGRPDSDAITVTGITDNSPLRGGKAMFYEGGIRVPLIIRWPGSIPQGSISNEPVKSIDFYPTYLEAAGLSKPKNHKLDGVSFLPVLKDPEYLLNRDVLYWHFPGYPNAAWRTKPVSVIRSGDWKLLKFYETDSVELYNLIEDVSEKNNLSETQPEISNHLKQKLENWLEEVNAPLPRWP
jgi:arylsulfatase A-like enzyme